MPIVLESKNNSGASVGKENGNLSMREVLVMTSACYPVHPPVQTKGVGEGDSAEEVQRSPGQKACVYLNEKLTTSPRGSQWSSSSKIFKPFFV